MHYSLNCSNKMLHLRVVVALEVGVRQSLLHRHPRVRGEGEQLVQQVQASAHSAL